MNKRKEKSTPLPLQQQCVTSFCTVCGVLFNYKRESTVVSSGVRSVTLVTHICSHSTECLYATFCNQTWYCGAPPWAGMSCEKMGFYLQGNAPKNKNKREKKVASAKQPSSIHLVAIVLLGVVTGCHHNATCSTVVNNAEGLKTQTQIT